MTKDNSIGTKISASWILELNCECPNCKKYVNLIDYDDFWGDMRIHPCELEEDLEVVCPECNHEFKVDCK